MTQALLMVDVQHNMLRGATAIAAAEQFEERLRRLLDAARARGGPVVHVQNDGAADDPDAPGTPGWELVFEPAPGEPVYRKDQQDTFAANPGLADQLRAAGVTEVVVVGLVSEYCVAATARGARRAGFAVRVPRGAHATYDDVQPAAEIERQVEAALAAEGIEIAASY